MTVPPQQNGDAKVITDQVSTEVDDAILNNADNVVPQATQRLWNEVAHGIDKNSTGESLTDLKNKMTESLP